MTAAGSEIPAGSVVITPQDMWDSITRIESGMNDIKNQIAPQVVDLRADHEALRAEVVRNKDDAAASLDKVREDHETRIRAVEKANWKQAGIYAAITVIATIGEAYYYTVHH